MLVLASVVLLAWVVAVGCESRTFWTHRDSDVRKVLSDLGHTYVNDETKADFIWSRPSHNPFLWKKVDHGRWLNRVRGAGELVNKALFHNLLRDANLLHLQPLTFDLDDQEEYDTFFRDHCHGDEVWVSKAPDLARGMGMFIDEPCASIRERAEDESVVVQRYVDNPLLVRGRKIEMRFYWMIANAASPLCVLLYPMAQVRVAAENYTDVGFGEAHAASHILNTFQIKRLGKMYDSTKLKLTAFDLADYLEEVGLVADGRRWLNEELIPFTSDALRAIVEEVRPDLEAYAVTKNRRFEVFGVDILLDANLDPWITEIQLGPGMSLDPGPKEVLVRTLFRDMLEVLDEMEVNNRCVGGAFVPVITR